MHTGRKPTEKDHIKSHDLCEHPAENKACLRSLQPLAFVALCLIYIWLVQPTRRVWLTAPFLTLIVIIPIASNESSAMAAVSM